MPPEKGGLHFVGVEVGEESVAIILKTFHLLTHELAGEVVDGFCGGEIFGNLEVQLVGIVMDELFALGEICGKEEEVLATDLLTDFFDNGYDEIPEDNGTQELRTVHGRPEVVGGIVGTEMN